MNTVDIIGTESICKLIRQSKLSKFIIFKQGALRGAVPVYRCEDTRNVDGAVSCFKDWADSVLRENPHNNLPYELFLYSQKVSSDEIDESIKSRKGGRNDEEIDERDDLRSKRDRIRFSFSLRPYNNSGMGSGPSLTAAEVGSIISETLDKRERDNELKRLREENLALKMRGRDRDDEEDEDDEEESEQGGALDKVYRVLREVNKAALIKKGKYAEAAGDDDDDEDDDIDDEDEMDEDEMDEDDDEGDGDEEEEEEDDDDEGYRSPKNPNRDRDRVPKKKKELSDKQRKKLERMKAALRTLWRHDSNLDHDLMILAKIAEKNPKLFKTYISGLRDLNF